MTHAQVIPAAAPFRWERLKSLIQPARRGLTGARDDGEAGTLERRRIRPGGDPAYGTHC